MPAKKMQNPTKWYGKKVAKNIDLNSIPTSYFVSVYSRRLYHVNDYATPPVYTREMEIELAKFGLDVASEISLQDENEIMMQIPSDLLERNQEASYDYLNNPYLI